MTITIVKGITATDGSSGSTFTGGSITNSTINSTTIGATTPAAGTFTIVKAASGSATDPGFSFTGSVSANTFGMFLNGGSLGFSGLGTQRLSILAGGQVAVSNSITSIIYAMTSSGGALASQGAAFQVNGTGEALPACTVGVSRFSNDTAPSSITLAKSRSGTIGVYTVITSGDALGAVNFNGADGTAMRLGAQILCESDGTPGASDMPGRLVFKTTPDGSATPSTALTILSNQNVGIGQAIPLTNLDINGYYRWNGAVSVTTQFDKTSDVALANVPGLSVTLVAGKKYHFKAQLITTFNTLGGIKCGMAGTATATSINYFINSVNNAGTAITASLQQALPSSDGNTGGGGASANIIMEGNITVNAGGTLTAQFAQNVSNGTASSVLVGSTLIVNEIA